MALKKFIKLLTVELLLFGIAVAFGFLLLGKFRGMFFLFFAVGVLILFSVGQLLRLPGIALQLFPKFDRGLRISTYIAGIPSLALLVVGYILGLPQGDRLRLAFTHMFLTSFFFIPAIYSAVLKDRKFAEFQSLALSSAIATFLLLMWLAGSYL